MISQWGYAMFVLDENPEELKAPTTPKNPCVGQIWMFIEDQQFVFRYWDGKEWARINDVK